MRILIIIFPQIILLLFAKSLSAQTFENVTPDVTFGDRFGRMIMADLDNDGNPEIIQTGLEGLKIFGNNSGNFQEFVLFPEFWGASQGSHTLDVGDIDRDGFIDILQSGDSGGRVFYILLNNNPGFTNVAEGYFNGLAGDSFLGDFEGDGDLDIIYSGADNWSNDLAGIMLNKNAKFISGPWFTQRDSWFATWCDFDQDSELEVIQSVVWSYTFDGNYMLQKNYPSMTVDKKLNISSVIRDISFSDYDADGDLDILVKQDPNKIYNNENGSFIDSGISFPKSGTVEFADINNDGYYDVILGGIATATRNVFETGIYLNQQNGSFTKLDAQIPAFERSCATIADIDSDGDLDIPTQNGVYRNNNNMTNLPPSAPTITEHVVSGSSVKLSWQHGSDDKSPDKALTYNISVRSSDGSIVVPSHSLSSGKRQIYKMGNVYNKLSFNLSCLKKGTYYWKVQTLDASFLGSEFSPEQSFTITEVSPVAPSLLTAKPISDIQIDLSWVDESSTEDEFIIFRKESGSEFDYSAIDSVSANTTNYSDTIYLQASTTYLYKVLASNCAYPDEFSSQATATTFSKAFVNSEWLNLGETEGSMVLLGDYDNDEDLDMLLSYSGSDKTKLFRFDGDGYVDSEIHFPFVASRSTWIDYNNDGYIDVLFNINDFFNGINKLYKNEEGKSFSEVTEGDFTNEIAWQGGVSLGDYDNDGDEDMLVSVGSIIHLYDNNGKGKFVKNENIVLNGYLKSNNAWGDYDRDGDLDILANKQISCTSNIIVIFENNSNKGFLPVEFPNLEGINNDYWNFTGDMEWGDYNNDGYPDIIVSGQNSCGNGSGITNIYSNNGNKTFGIASPIVRQIYDVNVDWGDYDNDGDLDIFMYGDPFGAFSERSRIFRNSEGQFNETNINYLLNSQQFGKAARGDIDSDGDLDWVILGEEDYVNPRIVVYKNTYAETWGKANQAPTAPTSLKSTIHTNQSVTLSWTLAQDLETSPDGLTYNLYMVDENDSILTNSYSLPNGRRKIVASGNASSNINWSFRNLKPGTYRWAVQSIDNGFAGSAFSEEDVFVIDPLTINGIEEYKNESIVYPNPFKRYLVIKFRGLKSNTSIELTNLLGQRILNIPIDPQESTLDLSSLPNGIYFMTFLNSDSNLEVHRIIKQ